MARNGNIILAKGIGMDKEHKNIINYSSTNMLALLRSQAHFVGEKTDYSFISENGKGGNVIATNFTYQECKNANYIAFQNPTYYNKWIFAFIDEVTYENNGCTKITFTVDNWATWFDNLTFKSCFVVREHVNSDTIGEHTVSEDLETGDYVINNVEKDTSLNNLCIVTCTSVYSGLSGDNAKGQLINGIFTGLAYTAFDISVDGINAINSYIQGLVAKPDAIISIFMYPKALIPGGWAQDLISKLLTSDRSTGVNTYNKTITPPTTINGYTPKNNKLFVYPSRYLILSNNNGVSNILQYEYFSSTYTFKVEGVVCPGGSIRCIPQNYKGMVDNQNEAISCGKFPTCAWTSDAFTNWMTSNAVNLGIGIVGDVANIVSGNYIGAAGGIASQVSQIYQHSLVPPTVKGNTNTGDVVTSSEDNTFYFYHMSIKQEFARIIDDYFTRFGYKVNSLKVPNITGRTYWNYVEIGAGEDIAFGNLPIDAMEDINNIFRRGTTIWHNHDNIGNFTLNNTIVS